MTDLTTVSPMPEPWTGGTWEQVTDGALEHFGADLEKGAQLIGYPMCLVRATFREGDFTNPVTKVPGWYVSLDAIIGPQNLIDRAIRRGRIPEENWTAVDPDEHLVFNEGGTGVYRQVVEYLVKTGIIRISEDLPEGGAYGESRYDVLPPEWEIDSGIAQDVARVTASGEKYLQFDVRILCPRGLRASNYENEFTKSGETRYLA